MIDRAFFVLVAVLIGPVAAAGCATPEPRPLAPWGPDPYVGVVVDPIGVSLRWVGDHPAGSGSVDYRVFLDDKNPPDRVACPGSVDEDCGVFDLGFEKTYYWQVETRYDSETVQGRIWSFETDRCSSSGWCPTDHEKRYMDNYDSGYPLYGT